MLDTPSRSRRPQQVLAFLRSRRAHGASVELRQLVQTVRLQRLVTGGGRVLVTGRCQVRLRQGATIEMAPGARLQIGSGGASEVMDADKLRAAVYLAPGARLVIEGGFG